MKSVAVVHVTNVEVAAAQRDFSRARRAKMMIYVLGTLVLLGMGVMLPFFKLRFLILFLFTALLSGVAAFWVTRFEKRCKQDLGARRNEASQKTPDPLVWERAFLERNRDYFEKRYPRKWLAICEDKVEFGSTRTEVQTSSLKRFGERVSLIERMP